MRVYRRLLCFAWYLCGFESRGVDDGGIVYARKEQGETQLEEGLGFPSLRLKLEGGEGEGRRKRVDEVEKEGGDDVRENNSNGPA